jgi:hypothetical protein
MTVSGGTASVTFALPPRGRRTVTLATDLGLASAEFATTIESDEQVAADRLMTWDASGYGAHAESGVAAPASRWYFAEGATHSAFDLFYLLFNPNDEAADVHVRFLLPPPAAAIERTYRVPARSRRTVWVDEEDPALASTDVAVVVSAPADRPIVAERAMYLSRPGELFAAGHAGVGVTELSSRWWFAEAATGEFFDAFLLVSNPNLAAADLDVTYLLADGRRVTVPHRVEAESRLTIWIDGDHPPSATPRSPSRCDRATTCPSSRNGPCGGPGRPPRGRRPM